MGSTSLNRIYNECAGYKFTSLYGRRRLVENLRMRPRRPVGGVSAGLEAVTVVDTMVEEGGLGGKRCPCEPSVGEWDRRGEETRFGRRETDDGDGDGRARGEGAFAGREVAVGRVD
jgi:hypothetical protein